MSGVETYPAGADRAGADPTESNTPGNDPVASDHTGTGPTENDPVASDHTGTGPTENDSVASDHTGTGPTENDSVASDHTGTAPTENDPTGMGSGRTIKVDIAYFGMFSQYAGVDRETLELKVGTTLRELTAWLCSRHGETFTTAFQTDLDYRSALVAINGEVAQDDRKLQDGDALVLTYPAGGG